MKGFFFAEIVRIKKNKGVTLSSFKNYKGLAY